MTCCPTTWCTHLNMGFTVYIFRYSFVFVHTKVTEMKKECFREKFKSCSAHLANLCVEVVVLIALSVSESYKN